MAADGNVAGKLEAATELAHQVAEVGRVMGLPYVAAAADIGNPRPMYGSDGRAFVETIFRWVDPDLRYWEDRGFALRAAFISAARVCSEPFYFTGGRLASWRPNAALEAVAAEGPIETFGVGSAIVAPAYLPDGVIGAVVWASPDAGVDVARVFAERAGELHALALKFLATYADATGRLAAGPPAHLTRREVQCLKWAAAGKTDAEVARIVAISTPTVRFHINNAARKLGVAGRSQAIRRAATLGYIGSGDPPPADSPPNK
jgi:DNA-binding CsgD family transcriptional regulator